MNFASKIPPEILGEIFLHAVDGPVSNIPDNDFPWAIDRVCKTWRSTFVTYPDLWTWITINLDESCSRGQSLITANQCLSLCLERSRNNPLTISLHLPTEEFNEHSPDFTLVWNTFLSCSARWRIVHLTNVLENQFFTLNSRKGETPLLEALTIHSPMDTTSYNDFTAFQIAPHLTRFTLLHPAAMYAVRKWSVPWMQLTTLMLRFEEIVGVDQLYYLFKQLRDIEELCLVLEGDEPGIELSEFVHNSETPHCLRRLRALHVCCVEALGFVTAPSLSELYLEGSEFFYPQTGDGDPNGDLAEEILSGFIHRSSCKIHRLTLADFSDHPFTPLVQLFPGVVELRLADAMMCLGHLLSPDQFPALRVLDCITQSVDVSYFIGTLLSILEVRNSATGSSVSPLTRVIFRPVLDDGEESSAPITTTDWLSFEAHVQVGLCCEFDLTNQVWSPEWGRQSSPSATSPHIIDTPGPTASSSIPGEALAAGSMTSQQPNLFLVRPPPNTFTFGNFDSNILQNDGDINLQWFNGEDDTFFMK